MSLWDIVQKLLKFGVSPTTTCFVEIYDRTGAREKIEIRDVIYENGQIKLILDDSTS